ncbi:MAG: hypothetical protein ACI4DY_13430 [Monoglobaceae bacterium]
MYDENKEGRNERVLQAAAILGTPETCRAAMQKVVEEWPIATQYNLSNAGINRKAWLGQACCSIWAGIHEDEVREAWGTLSDNQRTEANHIAYQIIKKWLDTYELQHSNQISFFE